MASAPRRTWADIRAARFADKSLRRRLWLAGAALLWERLWPALWPATAVAGLFVVLSLFGLWTVLPGWLHLLLLLAFLAAFTVALGLARDATRLPDLESCIARLERTGGVAHRPLTSALDQPAGRLGAAGARRLWELHRQRMSLAARRMRVTWPAAGLARRDPYGLRAALLLFGLVGLAVAGEGAPARLAAAVEPQLSGFGAAEPGRLTAWITPPDYTGLAPVFLTGRPDNAAPDRPIKVAEGSRLVARVEGGRGVPSLRLAAGAAGADAPATLDFTSVEEGDFEIEHALTRGGRAEIVQGRAGLGAWTFELLTDNAPSVSLVGPPQKTAKGVLRLEYQAQDDYGLARLSARITRTDDSAAEPLRVELRVPGEAPRTVKDTTYHDLTPHPWAGMPVTLTLVAEDIAGKRGESAPLATVLPARPFKHPVAKAIVEQRRTLALAPAKQDAVRGALDRISSRPADYGDDVVAYIALRAAVARLRYPQSVEGRAGLLDLLWDVALRIEDGSLSLAERDLRQAENALRDALDQNAANEDIQKLVEQLQNALKEYLDRLQEQPDKAPAEGRQSESQAQRERTRSDLEQMIEQTRDLAVTGARQEARQMLREMQETLENLRRGRAQVKNRAGKGEPLMRQLEELMKSQDELLNDTFDRLRADRARTRFSPRGGNDKDAKRQEALRRKLGEVMRKLGEGGKKIPDPLGKAERLMRAAGKELERGRPDRAVRPQGQALNQLRKGATTLRQRQTSTENSDEPGQNAQPRRPEAQRDPFGRLPPGNEGDPNGYVKIPDKSDIQRSRRILDELYRRAGERHRPESERAYIERLLRWY